VTRLKPAQIADIIESASSREEEVLLAYVHEDPELEADVFEELDDNKQAKLLHARSDEDVAGLLSRMRADDAADAIMELAQERRQGVLDRLVEGQKTKILTLLGYHEATAGDSWDQTSLPFRKTKRLGTLFRPFDQRRHINPKH
jgi:Mg/Co/Ni transporter MgtE